MNQSHAKALACQFMQTWMRVPQRDGDDPGVAFTGRETFVDSGDPR